jgi:hypothetical protein
MSRAERARAHAKITPRAELTEAATGDRFLILVEGSETEKRYLEDLCGKLNFSAYSVVILSPDTDPVNLVEKAVELKEKEEKLERNMMTVAYNQVWAVCDREWKYHQTRERLQQACALAEKHGVLMAISIPSFEYWLLLHFYCGKTALADCAAAEEELNLIHNERKLPAYTKAAYPLEVYVAPECVERACKYAHSIRRHHHEVDPLRPARYWAWEYVVRSGKGDSAEGNPSTDVDQLVRQLNLSANPRFRFIHFGQLSGNPFER